MVDDREFPHHYAVSDFVRNEPSEDKITVSKCFLVISRQVHVYLLNHILISCRPHDIHTTICVCVCLRVCACLLYSPTLPYQYCYRVVQLHWLLAQGADSKTNHMTPLLLVASSMS